MANLTADDLVISEPCHEAWDAMTPRDQGRHCDSCNMHVLDLSSMRAEEAEEALAARRSEGRACVRYGLDGAGNIVFAAPRPAATAPQTKRALPVVTTAKRLEKLAFAMPILLAACSNHPVEVREESCSTTPAATTDTLDRSWHVVGDDEVPPHVLGGGTTRPSDPLGTDAPVPLPPPVRPPPPPPQPPIVRHVMGDIAEPPKMGKIAIPRR